jgi:hypothetical protein
MGESLEISPNANGAGLWPRNRFLSRENKTNEWNRRKQKNEEE